MTQKQRSLTLLGVTAAVAAGAGLYAWLGVFKANKAKEEAKTASDTLFSFKKDQIAKLAITSHGQTVEATRLDGGWEIEKPFEVRADKIAFDGITDKLGGLKQKRDIGEPSDLGQYGLTAPKVSVTATLDDGSSHALLVGMDNTYDGTVYAKTGDSPRVSILDANVKYPLDKGYFELRDKRVMVFEDNEVKHLDVSVPGFAYGLDRTSATQWKVTAPTAMDADSQKASQILTALKNLRATRFPTDQASQADLTQYGLDKPTATVELQLDKDRQLMLAFGQKKEGTTDHTYVKVADRPFVAEVAGQILKDLTVTLGDLRDKTILSFELAAVKGFKFTAGEQTFEVHKAATAPDAGGDAWELGGDAKGTAKKWKLSSLVSSLHDLKGTSIVTEKADAKGLTAAGLDKPEKTVVILGEGDKVLGKLLVGKVEGSKANVKLDGSPKIYLVDNFKVSNLPTTLADIADPPPAADGGVTAQK